MPRAALARSRFRKKVPPQEEQASESDDSVSDSV